VFFEIIADTHY